MTSVPDGPPLAERTWAWSLYAYPDGRHRLVVVCGSVGLYERVTELTDAEVEAWQDRGDATLDPIAADVRDQRREAPPV